MTELKKYWRGVVIVSLIWMAVAFVLGLYIGKAAAPIFHDGEGNEIPTKTVRTLVESQYVYVTAQEDSLLRKWFPAYAAQPGKIDYTSK